MHKYMKKQQVEKMFRNDIKNINIIDKQMERIYWVQLLNFLNRNGGITQQQYNCLIDEKICN